MLAAAHHPGCAPWLRSRALGAARSTQRLHRRGRPRGASPHPPPPHHPPPQICLLTDFAPYTGNSVHQTGGLSLLPSRMATLVRPSSQQLEQAVDVDKPCLTDEEGLQQWNHMVRVLLLACAGLVKYLIDAYPSDLPEYDPQ
jgi:hypothetical protein